MKNSIEWLEDKHDKAITIRDVMDLQNDARKDGLMSALLIASEVINRESPKYSVPGETYRIPEMVLSGLNFFVTNAICTEADKLDYLPGKRQPK